MMKKIKLFTAVSALALIMGNAFAVPISLETQGSYTVGGKYVTHKGNYNLNDFVSPNGQRAYGDFAYVNYQIPENAKKLPLIFQHGGAQFKRTWESGVDGREGFNTLFLRKGYSVHLIDQPRSGESNLSTEAVTLDTTLGQQSDGGPYPVCFVPHGTF